MGGRSFVIICGHSTACVTRHVSPATCQHFFLHFFILKKLYKVFELVGGESVIYGAYPI